MFLLLFILKVLDVSENQVSKVIEAKEIMTLLPHRYPFFISGSRVGLQRR